MIKETADRASAIFAHHVGQGPEVPGYGATPWRKWLICAPSLNYGWFAVLKTDPLAKPRQYNCSLAQAKANLLAGY